VTGSNGKTTLLHLLESQIGKSAKYSHHANSSFGIPFDILDLQRKSLLKSEWISLIFNTPFAAFKNVPKEKLYVVEADCDRPGEGKFLAEFLKPEIVLWVSSAKTHSMNFDSVVKQKKFVTVEEAIAYEFGYFLEYCQALAVINGDSDLELKQAKRTKAKIIKITKEKHLQKYQVNERGTIFDIENKKYLFKSLLPEDVFYQIEMCKLVTEYLNFPFDSTFSNFLMPPGRGSIFNGLKDITIIDSSYNLSPGSLKAVLEMYNKIAVHKKWVVVGDMLELGESEREEHENLAELLAQYNFEKIILMGPRVSRYTYPKLVTEETGKAIEKFMEPKETLDYLINNITGGETILFKGARFMEGIIERLLHDKKDSSKLARREKSWEIRRKQWGL